MINKFLAVLAVGASIGLVTSPSVNAQAVDCTNPANAANPACLGLPDPNVPITNFVPLIAPLAAAAGLAALAGGGGTTTTGTTTTTSTSATSTTGGGS